MPTKKKIDGEHVLYHFLQKELLLTDIWLFQMLAAKLVACLGIWMRPELYSELPLLVPFAVRDNSSRKNNNFLRNEEWGSPNKEGYFRDDNSMIKSVPRNMKIKSPLETYNGKYLGNGFVASHVWRATNQPNIHNGSASKNPKTYSFVPNLVWLPRQVSKLTDREGSFTQLYLQALSWKIYRHAEVKSGLKKITEECWSLLAAPEGIPEQGLPDLDELSFFDETAGFTTKKMAGIRKISEDLFVIVNNLKQTNKTVSTRYTEGLKDVDKNSLLNLANFLKDYSSI